MVVRVGRRSAAAVVTELAGTEPWQPRVLAPDGPLVRVVLVQSRASLLGGDDVRVAIDVAGGCALEVVELAATLAHHARGGPPARLRAGVRLGPEARLIWLGQPLIAAAGCALMRSTEIDLAAGAAVLTREMLVLGRAGEQPGRVRSHTRIALAGRPVLEETLDTEPAWLLRSSVVAGQAGMLSTLTLAGLRDADAPAGAQQAHEAATLWRSAGPAVVPDASAGLVERWRGLVLDVPRREIQGPRCRAAPGGPRGDLPCTRR